MRDWAAFTAAASERERNWDLEGLPILRARLSVPCPEGKGWRRIRRFYAAQGRSFQRYCRGDLLRWAEAEGRAALEAGREPPCAEAELSFQTMYRAGKLWSVLVTCRETAYPGPPLVRYWGDTWDLSEELPVPVSAFFPPRTPWRKRMLAAAEREIRRQERLGISRFYPDWPRRLRKHFRPSHYILSEQGIRFFYPMFTLAPAAEGVPLFTLPWEGEPPSAPVR